MAFQPPNAPGKDCKQCLAAIYVPTVLEASIVARLTKSPIFASARLSTRSQAVDKHESVVHIGSLVSQNSCFGILQMSSHFRLWRFSPFLSATQLDLEFHALSLSFCRTLDSSSSSRTFRCAACVQYVTPYRLCPPRLMTLITMPLENSTRPRLTPASLTCRTSAMARVLETSTTARKLQVSIRLLRSTYIRAMT